MPPTDEDSILNAPFDLHTRKYTSIHAAGRAYNVNDRTLTR